MKRTALMMLALMGGGGEKYEDPSYESVGGTGDRTASIVVSTTLTMESGKLALVDGSQYGWGVFADQEVVGKEIKFDFGTKRLITELKYYLNITTNQGIWKFQGSNNDITWVDIGVAFTLEGSAAGSVSNAMSMNSSGYRYYRLLGVSGSTNATYNREMEFKIGNLLPLAFDPYTLITATNAEAPLITPTYDGSGQAVHPDVYDAGEGNTWNGHRYWMVMTPYPNNDSALEKPSILVSDDKVTWGVPEGLTNPINNNVRPDTDIVLDQDSVMWVIATRSTGGTVVAQSSLDGVTWSAETNIIINAGTDGILSPALVYYGGQWLMFSVRRVATPTNDNNVIERRACATLTGTWSDPVTCVMPPNSLGYYWHLDVIAVGSTLYMCLQIVSKLYLAYSYDGGLHWTFCPPPMLLGEYGTWNVNIYRSTIVRTATGFDLWYSANDNGSPIKTWGVAYVPVSYL